MQMMCSKKVLVFLCEHHTLRHGCFLELYLLILEGNGDVAEEAHMSNGNDVGEAPNEPYVLLELFSDGTPKQGHDSHP